MKQFEVPCDYILFSTGYENNLVGVKLGESFPEKIVPLFIRDEKTFHMIGKKKQKADPKLKALHDAIVAGLGEKTPFAFLCAGAREGTLSLSDIPSLWQAMDGIELPGEGHDGLPLKYCMPQYPTTLETYRLAPDGPVVVLLGVDAMGT